MMKAISFLSPVQTSMGQPENKVLASACADSIPGLAAPLTESSTLYYLWDKLLRSHLNAPETIAKAKKVLKKNIYMVFIL